MANTDTFDPFVESDEVERTFIKPNPGGRRQAEPARSTNANAATITPKVDLARFIGINPLVAAANPLLVLTSHLRTVVAYEDVKGLREQLLHAVKTFESNARARHLPEDTTLAARYSLCTLIDETIMSLPWGSGWGGHSLLVTFHNDNLGGEKVFSIIERALDDPRANTDLLELLYLCLSFGFQGRYRLKESGRDRLNEWRERLHLAIRQQRGECERELSPFWRGAVEKRNPLMRIVPLWVIGACAGAILIGVYTFFSMQLSREAEPLLHTLASIPGTAFDPKPAPARTESRLRVFLAAEIAQHLVRVDDTANQSKVTIVGDGLFESGSASLTQRYSPLVERIAAALKEVPGRIQIVGHTDDRRIISARFPSNWDLSQARAEEVARLLTQAGNAGERFHAIGRGDSEPLVANDTPASRARNRRVEIIVQGHTASAAESGATIESASVK